MKEALAGDWRKHQSLLTGISKSFSPREYLPASYKEVGAWQMPEGGPMYGFPGSQVHDDQHYAGGGSRRRGLSEVKRIRAAMQGVMDQVGFKGTVAEFFTFLQTDLNSSIYSKPEE